MSRRCVLLVLLFACSCRARIAPSLPFVDDLERSPTNAEILAYLDGQPLPLPPPASNAVAIRLERIEALSVQRQGVRNESGARSTNFSLIYNSWRARYDVTAAVEHRVIDGKRVISALRIECVARRH